MLHTLLSNSYELLREALAQNIAADRKDVRSSPGAAFMRPRVIVPSEAVKDDISRHIASGSGGICSGIDFEYIGDWLRPYVGELFGQSKSGGGLDWLVWRLLDDKDFIGRPECARLKNYLDGKRGDGKFALARRISQIFAKYASYRTDWVLEWMGEDVRARGKRGREREDREKRVLEKSPDCGWQRLMWQRLADMGWNGADGLRKSRARYEALLKDKNGRSEPPLHIFVPESFPPVTLPFLQIFARNLPITLYIADPSREYWFEGGMVPKGLFDWKEPGDDAVLRFLRRNAASDRALVERVWLFSGDPAGDEPMIEDDRAVPGWKGETRTRRSCAPLDYSQLADIRASNAVLDFVGVRMGGESALGRLQSAILECDDSLLPKECCDESLVIARAPGATREVEVLADWIDHTIDSTRNDDPADRIGPGDILVVTPDIERLAPLIRTAMGERISYRVAGRPMVSENPAAAAVLAAGSLIGGRASFEDFGRFIAYPLVASSWNLGPGDRDIVCRWLATAGCRVGLNDRHLAWLAGEKRMIPEGENPDGTLRRAVERLLLGSMAPEGRAEAFCDTMPMRGTETRGYDDVSERPELLSFLLSLEAGLSQAAADLSPRTAKAWEEWTQDLVSLVFPSKGRRMDPELARFLPSLAGLALEAERAAKGVDMPFETWLAALQGLLSTSDIVPKASDSVTFADMKSHRRLPYKAIAMVGMNGGPDFPGVERNDEFDLTAAGVKLDNGKEENVRRRGDRDSTLSNRNLFFDLILAARRRLYISYDMGRNPAAKANPSVVVEDLLRLLPKGSVAVRDIPAKTSDEKNFTTDKSDPLRSHDAVLCNALIEARKENFLSKPAAFADASLEAGDEPATAAVLAKFLQYPTKFSLSLADIAAPEDDEPGSPGIAMPNDALFKSSLKKRLLEEMKGMDPGPGRAPQAARLLALDPRYGATENREEKLRGTALVIDGLLSVVEEEEKRAERSFREGGGVFCVDPELPGLRVPAVTVHETPAGGEGGVRERFMCEVAVSSTAAARSRLKYLILAASGVSCRLILASSPGLKDAVERHEYEIPAGCGEAGRALRVILKLFAAQVERPPVLRAVNYDRNQSNGQKKKKRRDFDPLWYGADGIDKAEEESKDFRDSLENLFSAFELEKPAEPGAKKPRKKKKPREETIEEAIAALEAAGDSLLDASARRAKE